MLSSQELLEMSQIDITTIDTSTLVDIDTVTIDQELLQVEKIQSFIAQIKNPYCFMSGDIPVRIRFTGEGKTLSQALIRYFSQLKQR